MSDEWSVTSTLTPDAFGNAVATTGSTGNSYQFGATSGYRNDGDAGLLKVGCRYYDPQVGAFTTRDTYLDQKPYLYCEHDPVNATDPSGHDGIIDWITNGGHGYDFNFGNHDWIAIEDRMDEIGNWEITIGGGPHGISGGLRMIGLNPWAGVFPNQYLIGGTIPALTPG